MIETSALLEGGFFSRLAELVSMVIQAKSLQGVASEASFLEVQDRRVDVLLTTARMQFLVQEIASVYLCPSYLSPLQRTHTHSHG